MLFFFTAVGWINDGFQMNGATKQSSQAEEEEEETSEPRRNFTVKQLRHFDGTKEEQLDEDKPVYLFLEGRCLTYPKGAVSVDRGGLMRFLPEENVGLHWLK